jgi:hypothetical protein
VNDPNVCQTWKRAQKKRAKMKQWSSMDGRRYLAEIR